MKIYSIQNYTPSYKGSFVKDKAIKEFEKSLNNAERDVYENIIKNIENAKDENKWWYDTTSIRQGKVKLAVIGRMNSDGTPHKPGYFLDEAKNSLELFKKLAIWYEKNIEGFKK